MRVYNAVLSKWSVSTNDTREVKIVAATLGKAIEKGNSIVRKRYMDRVLSITEIIPEVEVAK